MSAAAAVVYCGWVFADRYASERRWIRESEQARRAAPNPEADRLYNGEDVRILSFYAGGAARGGALLCYGVVNATSVRIEPPVGTIWPSLSRCISVAPKRDTRYTLTAEGAGGKTVSADCVLTVKPARK